MISEVCDAFIAAGAPRQTAISKIVFPELWVVGQFDCGGA
jgi:hypothetical protein